MKNKISEKIIASLLVLSILFAFCSCGKSETEKENTEKENTQSESEVMYDKKAESYKKTETVYVNLKSDGSVKNINVTDWIHTEESEVFVSDKTTLKNVEEVKKGQKPTASKDGLRWDMESTDLYYTGTSDKELPVDFSIKYYLDGKEMTADEIAGKAGKVKIEVTAENKVYTEKTVNGKKSKIYLPVLVAGGTIFDETKFSAISVEGGSSIGDGSKEISFVTLLPGLGESLALNDSAAEELGISFPETGSFTVTTDSFELGDMYFAVIPLASLDIGLVLPDTLGELKNDMKKITALVDSVSKLDFNQISALISSTAGKTDEITDMLNTAVSVYSENEKLLNLLGKYMTEENIEKISELLKVMDDEEISQALEILKNPILQSFFGKLPEIAESLDEIMPLVEAMKNDFSDPEIKKSLENLPETLKSLEQLKKALDGNKELIDALSNLSQSDLTSVLTEIASGMDEAGIEKMFDKYSSLLDNTDELIESAKAWLTFGEEYGIYTDAADNAETSVMFIYKTDTVEKPQKVSSEKAEEELPWYKKLFSHD